MPIGYIVGNQYRIDTNYDRYANLNSWKLILRWMTKHGFSVETKFSHVGRNYTAEVKEMMRFQKSAHLYLVSRSLKSGDNPLSAMISAIYSFIEPDVLLSVYILEAECDLLRFALEDWRVREKKLNTALDTLDDLLTVAHQQAEATLYKGMTLFEKMEAMLPAYKCENCIGMMEHGCYCRAMGASEPGGDPATMKLYHGDKLVDETPISKLRGKPIQPVFMSYEYDDDDL